VGSAVRHMVGAQRGEITGDDVLSIATSARTLAPGFYRLEADLELDAAPEEPPYHAALTLHGDLVYVH
jgi:hypothetical protein